MSRLPKKLWLFLYYFFILAIGITCLNFFSHRTEFLAAIPVVNAVIKTDDVTTLDDSAEDIAIFVNEKNTLQSLIIGTNKNVGITVYDLKGNALYSMPVGEVNNIDLRRNITFNGHKVSLVTAGNRSTNTIDFFFIDADSHLQVIPNARFDPGLDVYGSCMYADQEQNRLYVFVNSKKGEVRQWEILLSEARINLELVRSFDVGTQTEGCVVDDRYHYFYICEETVGIWRYDAHPVGQDRVAIDKVDTLGGNLVADVEGLTLYKTRRGGGYLIASSQGDDTFAVYERKSGKFRGKFKVKYGDDFIRHTDGIDASSHYLGPRFTNGIFVMQDGNEVHAYQSFKYVPWNRIASKFFPPLELETRGALGK